VLAVAVCIAECPELPVDLLALERRARHGAAE
jgi:hypothetical protein